MTSDAARAAESAQGAPFDVDPWVREVSLFRAQMLAGPRLAERGASLASFHGATAPRSRSDVLLRRFAKTHKRLRATYAYLAREVRAVREPTPAEEWILDNAHIVEDQLREVSVDLPRGYLRELPSVTHGGLRGHPRVYSLCVDLLRHTDARVELEPLVRYVDGYQSQQALTIGELWAVPIMLRLGLLLIVARIATRSAEDTSHARARRVAERIAAEPARAETILRSVARPEVTEGFLVDLLHAIRQLDVDPMPVVAFLEERARDFGATVEDLSRRQHLHRAEDQLTVGNCVTSMRTLSGHDWTAFFERVSRVEAVLRCDPEGVYARSDRDTRDRCRHALERIARHARLAEEDVAHGALDLATRAAVRGDRDLAARHVGSYLGGARQPDLERALGVSAPLLSRVRRAVERHALPLYVGGVAALTALAVAPFARSLRRKGVSRVATAALAAPFAMAAADVSVGVMNALVVAAFPPRMLPRFEFEEGITSEHRALVVVPALLDSIDTAQRLVADLEVRALANPDPDLFFALLTDFCDAPSPTTADDDALLAAARDGIARLNAKHPREGDARFHLMHRAREHNPSQGCHMGWERKRGKLETLNRAILGEAGAGFDASTASGGLLQSVRYVITLDADTQLPRGAARRLVATIAHPMNRPHVDASTGRVTRGYGIIQPRVGTVPESARRSRYARVAAGPPGVDPYTNAVSDVYQDLFGEASYVGKGVYDVRAFAAALAERVPDNTLLSHDLFEGVFARAALASDVEVLDEQPASYAVDARRQHRWIRGDFQLVPWLLGARAERGAVPWLGRWKMLDNLRRATLPGALVSLVGGSAAVGSTAPAWAAGALTGVIFSPLLVLAIAGVMRRPPKGAVVRWPGLFGDLRANALRALVRACFVLDASLVAADAIARTLYRLGVSRRDLLEWTTTSAAERLMRERGMRPDARLNLDAAASATALVTLALVRPSAVPWLGPAMLAWALAPWIDARLRAPITEPAARSSLTAEARVSMRRTTRRTWRFFEAFVGAEDHWLPPDNYQQDPRAAVAHRTSPTNIGLYLLSCLAARDLGYITLRELIERLDATLDSIEQLRTHEGHLLNWYDTRTLAPLSPAYVSTVDSGNLVGHLWTLSVGLREALDLALEPSACFDGIDDALAFARASGAEVSQHRRELRAARVSLDGTLHTSARIAIDLGARLERAGITGDAEERHWLSEAARAAVRWGEEVGELAPFHDALAALSPEARADAEVTAAVDALTRATNVRALIDATASAIACLDARAETSPALAELNRAAHDSADACARLAERLDELSSRALAIANRSDFRFLYDETRSLFAIGYNVDSGQRDGSHYDLLASEARLASFVAIAKGDVREAHWFHLGRARVPAGGGASLVSWSGSMFEFLMPLLVMKRHEGTLLDETYDTVVTAQKQWGDERELPWGVSESAYNVLDLSMTYQYRAFGVQSLGLKSGLADDVVVAPYATALAAMVRPDLAAENFARLARDGVDGAYGFYEAVDFTPSRVPPNRRGAIVKAYMAHHQAMTLVALCNVLCDAPMPRRFHAHPPVLATELLLEERLPRGVPLLVERAVPSPAPQLDVAEHHHTERVTLDEAPLRTHLLAQGELATLFGVRGNGFITWRGYDVHRVRGEVETDPCGLFVYARDTATSRVWSLGFEPTRATPDAYHADLTIDRARIHRRDGDVESVFDLVVSPEHAAEVRRVTLTNLGDALIEIELTSWLDLSLAERGADLAHPAFSSMFVRTEQDIARDALVAHRRPRRPGDFVPWCAQTLHVERGDAGPLTCETSREAFIGRGRTLANPAAVERGGALTGGTGDVLAPGMGLRRTVRLAPRARAQLNLVTVMSDHRDGALSIIDALASAEGVERTCELAWADAHVELKHLGVSAQASLQYQRLLSAIVAPEAPLRASVTPDDADLDGRGALWSLGISGDLPIVVVRLDDAGLSDLCREALHAHEFLRVNHVQFDLLLLNDEPTGYLAPRNERALQVIRSVGAQGRVDQRGGVFLRASSKLSAHELSVALSSARVVLAVSRGSLARQLRRATFSSDAEGSATRAPDETTTPETPREGLFDNGLGAFTRDGREYVIDVSAAKITPAPWSNVIARPGLGALVTDTLGGFTWTDNSQRHRLTPWSNDPVCDPAGEALYLRDDATGRFIALTGAHGAWRVRHGHGYSAFERVWGTLDVRVTVSLDPDLAAKVFRVEVTNRGARRHLSLFACVDWTLGALRERTGTTLTTAYEPALRAVFARDVAGQHAARCAFLYASGEVRGVTCDRREFYGARGPRSSPRALSQRSLSGRVRATASPCGALHVDVETPERQSIAVHLALGEAGSFDEARAWCESLARRDDWPAAFERARTQWSDLLDQVQVRTPDAALDVMMNGWLPYQTLSCRVWGRSAFYQSGGAYGFRDQLQDVLAALYARPDVAREHIVRAASRQFEEGDVQHWWHPDTGEGVRTRCSDDMLWLPYAMARYVEVTGDRALLDEEAPFLVERQLAENEHDLYTVPRVSDGRASLYEHGLRALRAATTRGPNGLPLMRAGDWNDGMDRVGERGLGESVWLGFFLARVWLDYASIAEARGDPSVAAEGRAEASRLSSRLEERAWDGRWYRRAYTDEGVALGSAESAECRIDAIAQAWAELSGVADPARARTAIDSALSELVMRDEEVVLLLAPPFTGATVDPGYIASYPPGVRENGGQYTHGAIWLALALCQQGRGDEAYELLSMLNPVHHGGTASRAAHYRVEPYVIAADIYGPGEHLGRGGWTWYTGAAGWMYRTVLEALLGVQVRGDSLGLKPCAPTRWDGFSVTLRRGAGEYRIEVSNPSHLATRESALEATLDGRPVDAARIPLLDDGARHVVSALVVSSAVSGVAR